MPVFPEIARAIAVEGTEAAEASVGTPTVPTDSRPFFPAGSIEIHFPAARGNDTALDISEAAAVTRAANEAWILRRNFIDGITPVHRSFFPGKGMVEIMVPSSPYAYGGVMVASVHNSLLTAEAADLQNLTVPTETAFDLDPDLRNEYYRQILAGIQAEEDIPLPRGDTDGKVIAYENTVVSISNEQHRLPRSIVLPHMHIIKGGDWVNSSDKPPRPHGFDLEQRLSQNADLFARFRDQWFMPALERSRVPDALPALSLELRKTTPYGYTIATGIRRNEPLSQQARKLADLLCVNHEINTAFTEREIELVDESRARRRKEFAQNNGMLLPKLPSVKRAAPLQPAYRTYLYYREGELAVTVSPIFLTALGAMEGMETAVSRGLQHGKIFTDDELAHFFEGLSNRLQTLLGSDDVAGNAA